MRLFGSLDISCIILTKYTYIIVPLFGFMGIKSPYTLFIINYDRLLQVNLGSDESHEEVSPYLMTNPGSSGVQDFFQRNDLPGKSPILNQYTTRTGRHLTCMIHSKDINFFHPTNNFKTQSKQASQINPGDFHWSYFPGCIYRHTF